MLPTYLDHLEIPAASPALHRPAIVRMLHWAVVGDRQIVVSSLVGRPETCPTRPRLPPIGMRAVPGAWGRLSEPIHAGITDGRAGRGVRSRRRFHRIGGAVPELLCGGGEKGGRGL